MASLSVRCALGGVPRQVSAAARRRELSSLLTVVEEYPGLPSLSPEPAKASAASVTALASGLTVVTENAASATTVSLTFPKAGSADEAVSEWGAALINKNLAFKSASGLSSALILRNLEDDGAIPFSRAGRKSASVGFSCPPEKAARLLPLLALDCTFEKWDVRDAKSLAAVEVEDASTSAQAVLTEQLFAAAYGPQSAMGRPFYCADASTDTIKSFRRYAYGVNGAVLAATGIEDHGAFVKAVEESMDDALPGSPDAPAAASYLGGEARVAAPSAGYAHVALAFEGPVGSPMLNVLKYCLELSSGEGISSFASTGLVGVYGGADSAGASGIVDSLVAALSSTPSADIVKRAKVLAKADALFALEDGSKSLAESMTTSVLESSSFSTTELAAAYDSITDSAVSSAMSAMLKMNPSMAAVGDIAGVPYHATVASQFK